MRPVLVWLFVAMAAVDTGGKVIARNPAALRRATDMAAQIGLRVPGKQDHAGNFDIFRNSSRHLLASQDLYARYPAESGDRFKYSPTFALLFLPFSYANGALALFAWQLLNALALLYALTRVLPASKMPLATGIVALEVWRSMQNAQSNALVAATIVLAFAALEGRRNLAAAAWITLGAIVKIFPLAAAAFALPDPHRRRQWTLLAAALAVAVALPMVVTGPGGLGQQYLSWFALERADAQAHMQSVMALVAAVPAFRDVPNVAIQVAGGIVLLLPLVLRRERWIERGFRLEMLASVLLFVVLFNPQAERASYVIAFTGIAIWYASGAKRPGDTVLLAAAMIVISVGSIFVPGAFVRSPEMMLLRLVVPCLAIWLVLQVRMHRQLSPSPAGASGVGIALTAGPSPSPRLPRLSVPVVATDWRPDLRSHERADILD